MVDVLTVSNALGTNAAGAPAQAASPVTIDAVFGALLDSMSDSAAAVPQMPGVTPTQLFAPQAAANSQAAPSLASIVTLLQNGSDVTGEGSRDQSAYQATNFGALIVPASEIAGDSDNPPAESVAPQMPFMPRPAPQTTATPAPVQTATADPTAEQSPQTVAPQSDGEQNTPQATAAPVVTPVSMPATPAKEAAPQHADAAPATAQTEIAPPVQTGTTDTPPVKPQTGKTAAAPQPKSDTVDPTTLAMVMPAPVQAAPVKLQTTAPSDDDATPANDDSSDSDKAASGEQPATQSAPQPAVAVAMAVPAPAAPVQPSQPANDAVAPVTTAAPKPLRSNTPDDTTAPAETASTPNKPAAREASVPHATVKAETAAQPKTSDQPAPTSDQPQTSALRSVPDPVPATPNNNAAPQPDAQTASAQQQSPAPSAIPVIHPAQPQTAPSGLRKLTAGLQIAAQEQDTTTTLDKFGVSIVTKAVEGLRHFDIRLDPPELGRVEVRLTVDDSGKAQANLVVDKPQTLELLQRDQTNLNRALSDAGLDLSNNGLNFSLREQDRQNDGGTDQGRGRHLSAKAVVQTDVTPIHSSLGSYAPDSVRLDIRV